MAQFYEYSFMRDAAFLRNIRFAIDDKRKTIDERRVAVLVTGGFHTDNLRDLFVAKGISYIAVIPNFKATEGADKKYYALLNGKKSAMQESIEPFLPAALAIASYMNGLGDKVHGERDEIGFALEVAVREALDANPAAAGVRITSARLGLTRSIDREGALIDNGAENLVDVDADAVVAGIEAGRGKVTAPMAQAVTTPAVVVPSGVHAVTPAVSTANPAVSS